MCSIVEDDAKDLNGQVIKALKFSSQLSLKDCSLNWSSVRDRVHLNEVFRNQSIVSTQFMSEQKFEELKLTFKCEHDPTTSSPIEREFTRYDF